MANDLIGLIHMTGYQEKNCNSQMMMRSIGQPQTPRYWISSSTKSHKVWIFRPIQGEKWGSWCPCPMHSYLYETP